MSELIQVRKQLTFEEICPQHAYMISQWDKLTDEEKVVEIRKIKADPVSCFVGEAKRGDHICDCCWRYASNFTGMPQAFNTGTYVDWELFEQRKAEFVQHWNEVHINE